jgi:hypothetical protein
MEDVITIAEVVVRRLETNINIRVGSRYWTQWGDAIISEVYS